jgi:hypothetical protein
MAINSTTLSAAITISATQFTVGSTTNITAPVLTTGSGATLLYCEAELMQVISVPASGVVQVARGFGGTVATAHASGANVVIGLVTDFPNFTPQVTAFTTLAPNRFQGISPVVASSATIVAAGPVFHVSGTTAINIITPPANFVEGQITIIADGVMVWTSSAVTNGIAASGTVTTAKSSVSFIYDANTALWYPTRLA